MQRATSEIYIDDSVFILILGLIAKSRVNYRAIVHTHSIKIMHIFLSNKQYHRAYYLRDNAFVVTRNILYNNTRHLHTHVCIVNTLKEKKGKRVKMVRAGRMDTRDADIAVREPYNVARDENGMAYEFYEILTMSGKETRA